MHSFRRVGHLTLFDAVLSEGRRAPGHFGPPAMFHYPTLTVPEIVAKPAAAKFFENALVRDGLAITKLLPRFVSQPTTTKSHVILSASNRCGATQDSREPHWLHGPFAFYRFQASLLAPFSLARHGDNECSGNKEEAIQCDAGRQWNSFSPCSWT
jgi:hypothetical protein